MKPESRIQEIFTQAQERKSPAEREEYLAEVCAGNAVRRIESEMFGEGSRD